MPSNELSHYGVPGMRWGHRKAPSVGPEVVLTKQLKSGGSVTITRDPPPAIAKVLSRFSPGYKEGSEKYHSFTLTNGEGKKVGDASFHQDSPDSLNLVWLGIKGSHRGNGYATAAMEGVTKYAQDKGLKKLTLEVPGNAPDALHIYEKLGFVQKGLFKDSTEDDYWGGLTEMEYTVPKSEVKHADSLSDDVMDYIVRELDKMPSDNELRHYGVPGMKWGQRRAAGSSVRTSTDRKAVDTIRKKPVPSLTNKQLKTANNRLQLEKSYADLTKQQNAIDKINKGNAAAKSVLSVGGTAIAAYTMAQSPAAKAAVKVGVKFVKAAAAWSSSSGGGSAASAATSLVLARR
jgi:RimJ/RimL family protein N-acetyltransferase